MLKIQIETSNAAFAEGNAINELITIVADAMDRLPANESFYHQKLYDINGNPVGYIEFDPSDLPDKGE